MSGNPRRQRIRYVLPLDASPGHRLGVQGLAFDSTNSILYSGGRDGIVSAWDATSLSSPDSASHHSVSGPTCRRRVQAHTQWINDLTLAHSGQAVISASSDTTVKLWRPAAEDGSLPVSLGSHSDYVKCVTCPGSSSNWVASAGLDGQVIQWDLAGRQRLRFPASDAESEKRSVYALASVDSTVVTGGPDGIVRLHDTRTSNQRVTQFIGHSDNIRDLLISKNQDVIISCSSDRTVKVWSVVAGRCMSNLAMHNESVWSLFSDHPSLAYFFSGDRAGIVAKTDCRAVTGGAVDNAVSFALCQETEGINRISAGNGSVWTGTARSHLNSWKDFESPPGALSMDPGPSPRKDGHNRARNFSLSLNNYHGEGAALPMSSVMRLPAQLGGISSSARHRSRLSVYHAMPKRGSIAAGESEFGPFAPLRSTPEMVINGKEGIVKNKVLNNKRHLVTADTGGNVVLWDLITCRQVKSYGKQNMDDVFKDLNTKDVVSSWCSVDTNIGAVVCTLEEKRVFDGETYADEVAEAKGRTFPEDLRINLGSWVIRYLFDDFVRAERKLDEENRQRLREESAIDPTAMANPLPPPILANDGQPGLPSSSPAQRPQLRLNSPPSRYAIGTATPFLAPSTTPTGRPAEAAATSSHSAGPPSVEEKAAKSGNAVDYFSAKAVEEGTDTASNASQNENSSEASRNSSSKDGGNTSFGQRFRSTFSKKGRTSSQPASSLGQTRTPGVEDGGRGRTAEDGDATPIANAANGVTKPEDRTTDGMLLEMRREYARKARETQGAELESSLRPCMPEEALAVRIDPRTTVLIQEEEDPSSSLAVTDLFQGFPSDLGKYASVVEKIAPYWLGALLLKNERASRDPVKIPFLLKPMNKSLPPISLHEGDERLNANRIIRMRKAMEYVADRLQPINDTEDTRQLPPDKCIELWCQNQQIPPTMTLAYLRTHIWKGTGDVLLQYKATGRRQYHATKTADVSARQTA